MVGARIGVAASKGGVGKTTVAVNLAAWYAQSGLSVLLVDLDPNGHAAASLGLRPSPAVYRFLTDGVIGMVEESGQSDVQIEVDTVEARPNLHLLAGGKRSKSALSVLESEGLGVREAASALARLASWYDVTVFDTPPADWLQGLGFLAADYVVLPVAPEPLPVQACADTLAECRRLGKSMDKVLVTPSMVDVRLSSHVAHLSVIADVAAKHGARSFPHPYIRARAALKNAAAVGQTIFEYDPHSQSADDIGLLATALWESIGAQPATAERREYA